MGAWGCGPFDNDGALDTLGELALQFGGRGDDEPNDPDGPAVIIDPAGQAAVQGELAELLAAPVRPALQGEYRSGDLTDAYAAAGLVAAVLTGPVPQPGTRLRFALERAGAGGKLPRLGLDAACGYEVLLSPSGAVALAGPALAAVNALAADRDWLDGWSEPDEMAAYLAELAELLAALLAGPAAPGQ